MGSRLTISPPRDYHLARDVCSYGYFLLKPNHWNPQTQSLSRILDLAQGPVEIHMTQNDGAGTAIRCQCSCSLDRSEQARARAQIVRMLRLDEDETVIRSFHKVDPRFKRSGRGRVFRSPTFFEDVIKTVTSCNVRWSSTMHMNERLCTILGRSGAFPSAKKLARTRPTTLRGRCRVGYRDQRMVDLAKLFTPRGSKPPEMDPKWFEDESVSDEQLHEVLLTLPGIGPYAAANLLQLLGRYGTLPLDSEGLRHGRAVLGFQGTDNQVLKQVRAHFAPFGEHSFRSYWFELWVHYESRSGPAYLWDRNETQ